jgi:hypothetical protein
MKATETNEVLARASAGGTLGQWRLPSCEEVLAGISRVKASILAEARRGLRVHERMLRLALNEAEALACQTEYPHLLFPALAAEKLQALVAWHKHQQALWQTEPILALAA